MLETSTQPSQAAVRDPVCGMALEPAQAGASRTLGDATFYFCSEHCAQRFDREHAGSTTTGVSGAGRLRRIELAVAHLDGRESARRLEEHLESVPGVQKATANAQTKLVRMVFDPSQTQVKTIVDRARAAGYTLGTATTHLALQDLHCASCVVAIEEALHKTPGVLAATVNPATGQAHVEYLPGLIDRTELASAVEEAGYQVREAAAPAETALDRTEQDQAREYRTLLHKFWVAALVSLPVLVFSYPQFFPGLRDWLADGSLAQRLAWACLGVVTLPVMFWAGSHYFSGMWQALKRRQANMYTLIAIGVSAAWLYSSVAVAAPQLFPSQALAQTFYDVTAVVIALVNLGLLLELRARGRTGAAIKKLVGLQAKTARVERDGTEVDIPVEEVLVGETIVVRPGGWGRPGRELFGR